MSIPNLIFRVPYYRKRITLFNTLRSKGMSFRVPYYLTNQGDNYFVRSKGMTF